MTAQSTATSIVNAYAIAMRLRAAGVRLLPVGADKRPEVGGFDDPTFTCEASYWARPDAPFIGILCGHHGPLAERGRKLLCLDFDGDLASLASFMRMLPPTITTHGDRHMYFSVPFDCGIKQWTDVLNTKAETGSAVDLRFGGGYGRERWDDPAVQAWRTEDIAELPPEIIEHFIAEKGQRTGKANVARERTGDAERPDEGAWTYLVEGFAEGWPASSRRDLCFAIGGVLADKSQWSEDLAQDFLEAIFDVVGDVEDTARQDGIDCMFSSMRRLESGEDGGVLGLPTIAKLLRYQDIEDEMQHKAAVNIFVEKFVEIISPAKASPVPATAEGSFLTTAAVADTEDTSAAGYRATAEALATWQGDLQLNAKGAVKPIAHNLTHTLLMHPSWKGVFVLDEFTGRIIIARRGPPDTFTDRVGEPWSLDEGLHSLQAWMDKRVAPFGREMLRHGVTDAARRLKIHVVRQYFEGLPAWDGVERSLISYLGAEDTEHNRTITAMWLRCSVARIFEPGCHAKSVLILEGRQDLGKSTFLRKLLPNEDWFLQAPCDVTNKDFLQALQGRMIVEIGEIDRMIQSRDVSALKDLISSTTDTYRASYAIETKARPRSCIFAGTTNEHNYLRDMTGNVRFWPLACGVTEGFLVIPFEELVKDRDQLWAQALHEYRAGRPRWLNHEQRAVAEVATGDRMEVDPWVITITEQIKSGSLKTTEQTGLSLMDALAALPGAVSGAELDVKHTRRMSKVLRFMGWDTRKIWREGKAIRLWYPKGTPETPV